MCCWSSSARSALWHSSACVRCGAGTAVSNTVVIAEFRTRGVVNASDEFIELYNKGNTSVNIGQWSVKRSNATTATVNLTTIPSGTILAPGQHYLLTNSGYSGTVTGDLTYTAGIADNGGIGPGPTRLDSWWTLWPWSSGSVLRRIEPVDTHDGDGQPELRAQTRFARPPGPGHRRQQRRFSLNNYGASYPRTGRVPDPTAVTLLSFVAEMHPDGVLDPLGGG